MMRDLRQSIQAITARIDRIEQHAEQDAKLIRGTMDHLILFEEGTRVAMGKVHEDTRDPQQILEGSNNILETVETQSNAPRLEKDELKVSS